jgi:SWI/SNF-related matrix-associated actin-dependent regulator of chromatin subfamily A3
LPTPTKDFIYHLDFALEELELYEDVKKQTIPLIRNALASGQSGKAFNALQHLNSLRLICSHGRLAQSYQGAEPLQSRKSPMTHSQMNVHDSFFNEVLGDSSTCNYCGKELLEDFLDGVPSARVTAQLNASKDCPGMCEQCIVLLYQAHFRQWPSGDLLDAPCTPTEQSPTPSVEDSPFLPSIDLMPTKIKALVADLTEHAPLEKS